jgi:predicted nucleic acid-binding protein
MTAITFDTGALIAIERRSRRMQALLEEVDRHGTRIAVPAGVVAQAWRGGPRQARIAAVLSDERTEVVVLDDPTARAVGLLSARSGHPDVVDVSVAVCARQRDSHVVTSDPDGLHAVDPTLVLHRP